MRERIAYWGEVLLLGSVDEVIDGLLVFEGLFSFMI